MSWTTRRAALRILPVAVLTLALAPAGCKDKPPPAPKKVKTILGPVPEPPGLLAEVFIPKPEATWQKARRMVGGAAMFLPAQLGSAGSVLLGMPAQAKNQVLPKQPAVGAIGLDGTKVIFVIGFKVKNGNALKTILTKGVKPIYKGKENKPSALVELTRNDGRPSRMAIGITGDYLVLSPKMADLAKLAPYVTRNLPKRPMPSEDAVVMAKDAALSGPVHAGLKQWWQDLRASLVKKDQEARKAHGGSAPTYGDPTAALAKADETVGDLLAVLKDLKSSRLSLVLDNTGAHAHLSVDPKSPKGVAAKEIGDLVIGDTAPLLALPSDTFAAAMTRDSQALRDKRALEQPKIIAKIFKDKLDDKGKKRISEMLAHAAKGRGDWLTVGLRNNPTEHSFTLRAPVANQDELNKGIDMFIRTPNLKGFKEPLQNWLGKFSLSKPKAYGDKPKSQIVKIERTPKKRKHKINGKPVPAKKDKKSKPKKEKYQFAWRVNEKVALGVFGDDGKAALAGLEKPKTTLAGEANVARALKGAGNEVATAVVVMPFRVMQYVVGRRRNIKPKPAPAAPVLLSVGRSKGHGWLRIDAHAKAVQGLARIRASRR